MLTLPAAWKQGREGSRAMGGKSGRWAFSKEDVGEDNEEEENDHKMPLYAQE